MVCNIKMMKEVDNLIMSECFSSPDKLIITGCHSLNNIAALKSLITIKDITIIQCPLLYNFCAIKNVVKDTDCNFYTEGNGYNPTKYQLLNGECSKLPEE